MTIVVEAPGIPAYSYDFTKFAVRVDKWPTPGDVLPVEVDPEDPTDIAVLWDEIPTVRDAAHQDAERLAAQLREQQQTGMPPPAGGIAEQLQQMFPGAVINFGSDAPIAPPPPAPEPPTGQPPMQVVASQSDGDPVERLEKLARLRDAGIVDQAQFEQLRAQILGQAGLDP